MLQGKTTKAAERLSTSEQALQESSWSQDPENEEQERVFQTEVRGSEAWGGEDAALRNPQKPVWSQGPDR